MRCAPWLLAFAWLPAIALAADPDPGGSRLQLLAEQRPMTVRTADEFRAANAIGYFSFNALLLARNRSPVAMELFATMMLDTTVDIEERAWCLHQAIVPARTDAAILEAALVMLARAREDQLAQVVVESVFDYRQEWFNVEARIESAPAWSTASSNGLRLGARLADRSLSLPTLAPALRAKVLRARHEIAARR